MAELSLVVKIMKRVSQLADTENVKGMAFKWISLYVLTGVVHLEKKSVFYLQIIVKEISTR